MNKSCSKCGVVTEHNGDMHCREILRTKIKQLLLEDKIKEAERLILDEKGDEKWKIWKNDMYRRVYLLPELESMRQKENGRRWQKQIEIQAARDKFAEAAKKYKVDVNKIVDINGPTPLAQIIVKLQEFDKGKNEFIDENGKIWFLPDQHKDEDKISELEIKWLEENEHFELLADYCVRVAEEYQGSNGWYFATASKYYRMAKLPKKAIEITEGYEQKLVDWISEPLILTSRGGAFRDLKKLDEAKECANKAINISLAPHPYNLLGGIAYDEGKPEEADVYFAKAVELGSSVKQQEYAIKGVLQDESTDIDARKKIIDYLIKKDPAKYAWVKNFENSKQEE